MGDLTDFYHQEDVVSSSNDFGLITPGNYAGAIEAAQLRQSQKGGHYINIQIRLDTGRVVFDLINIHCPHSEEAENIGKRTLKFIAESNNRTVEDTSDIIGCRVNVRVGIRQQHGYPEQNYVKGYGKLTDAGTRPPIGNGNIQQRQHSGTAQNIETFDDDIPF